MHFEIVEPEWKNTIRFFAEQYIHHNFDIETGPMVSFIEQIRYLQQTQPDELEKILNELRGRDVHNS